MMSRKENKKSKQNKSEINQMHLRATWPYLGRKTEIQYLTDFLNKIGENALFVWGREECGINEFAQLTKTICEKGIRTEPQFSAIPDSGDQENNVAVRKNIPLITYEIDYEKRVFVSYAWGGKSEQIVDEIQQAFSQRGIDIVRDKKELEYKESIEGFELRIGMGQCIVLVISDQYLKSHHCMRELLEIYRKREFHDRIFPIILEDANIYKPIDRIEYIKFWDNEIVQLNLAIKQVNVLTNIGKINSALDTFSDIRRNIDNLIDLLSDMNSLTPEKHQESGYLTLIDEVEKSLLEKGISTYTHSNLPHKSTLYEINIPEQSQNQNTCVVYFDAEEMYAGINIDQFYFLNKLQGSLINTADLPSNNQSQNIDKRLSQLHDEVGKYLSRPSHQIILIFASIHLLTPAIREWCTQTLWKGLNESIAPNNIKAIFLFEGENAFFSRHRDMGEIFLKRFTLRDIEEFLLTLPFVEISNIPELASSIHSSGNKDNLASPTTIYKNFFLKTIQFGWAQFKDHYLVIDCIKLLCTPLLLTVELAIQLLTHYKKHIDPKAFWDFLIDFGILIRVNETVWRINIAYKNEYLISFEQENPDLAKEIHSDVLEYFRCDSIPSNNEFLDQIIKAYHVTPNNPFDGISQYYSLYCQSRATHRHALLSTLAHTTISHSHWLEEYESELNLFRAAAYYYEGNRYRSQTIELLETILNDSAPIKIILDVSYLLGTLRELSAPEEAFSLYQNVIRLSEKLEFRRKNPYFQLHQRITLAKAYFNSANVLKGKDDSLGLETAETYYRKGIQIVSSVEQFSYEASASRKLANILQKMGGQENDLNQLLERIRQIEQSFRQTTSMADHTEQDNKGYQYYFSSAINHGLGYEHQSIRYDVKSDGSTQIDGVFVLSAMSVMNSIDTYLETVPDSDIGVHFDSVESLTPDFTLNFSKIGIENPEAERLEIKIDPPMNFNDQLIYHWTAHSDPNTVAVTHKQLQEKQLKFEYAFWDVIAPMKYLQIEVTIPFDDTKPPPQTWFDIWRVGRWKETQTQSAYFASLDENPNQVNWQKQKIAPGRLRLNLDVAHPWLAMRYVLAWNVL